MSEKTQEEKRQEARAAADLVLRDARQLRAEARAILRAIKIVQDVPVCKELIRLAAAPLIALLEQLAESKKAELALKAKVAPFIPRRP